MKSSIEQATLAIGQFLESEEDYVFVLKGPYGSGKSYFLRKTILTSDSVKEKFPYISYASAFGLKNLKELSETAIGSVQVGSKGKSSRWLETGAKVIQKALKPAIGGVNLELSPSSILWTLAQSRGLLLVIDDIDRRAEDFTVNSIIGLANTLAENSAGNVRVILVLNEDQLRGERKVWEGLREKFIDVEFDFRPSYRELADKFVETECLRDEIVRLHARMGLPNIRTMKKLDRMVSRVRERLCEASIDLVQGELDHALRFGVMFLGAGEDYPCERLKEESTILRYPMGVGDGESNEETAFGKRASLIGYARNAKFDDILSDHFSGTPVSNDDVEDFKLSRTSRARMQEFYESQDRVTRLFEGTFRSTRTEFLKEAETHVSEFKSYIRHQFMQWVTYVTMELGGNHEKLWSVWLRAHAGNIDPDLVPVLRKAVPEALHSLFEGSSKRKAVEVDPETFFDRFTEGKKPLHPDDILVLSRWKPEDWVTWMKETKYENTIGALGEVLGTAWPNNKPFEKLKAGLKTAVELLSTENVENWLRAKMLLENVVDLPPRPKSDVPKENKSKSSRSRKKKTARKMPIKK